MKIVFFAIFILAACSTTSPKKGNQSRTPSSSPPTSMTIEVPLTPDQRNDLWQKISKVARLQYFPISTPLFQNGVTYAYCRNNLGIDFTKVKIDPFSPGPVTFLDKSGNVVGTGTLSEAKNFLPGKAAWWKTQLIFTEVKGAGLPVQFTLNSSESGSFGLDSEYGGKFQNCEFFANLTFADIVNGLPEKIIKYKILASSGLEKSAGKEGTDVINLTPRKIRGFLDNLVFGECKFKWYPRFDVLNVLSTNPNSDDKALCQFSPGTYLRVRENYSQDRNTVAFNGTPISLRFEEDGPHLYEITHSYDAQDVIMFLPDHSVPALEDAYRDASGLIWGSLVKDASGKVQLMSHAAAVRECEKIVGGRLPKLADYTTLIDHRGLYYFPGTKKELIPGLAQFNVWTGDQGCEQSHTCSPKSTYHYFIPNPGGEYHTGRTTDPDSPVNFQAVRCIVPADPYRSEQ